MLQKSLILFLLVPIMSYSHEPAFDMQNQISSRIQLDTAFESSTILFPFNTKNSISRLAISGDIALHSDSSLVRIILMDNYNNEFLIYETYPILAGSWQFSVDEVAEETSLLNNIIPYQISFEIVDASIYLKEINLSEECKYKADSREEQLHQQTLNKIDRINLNIQNKGQKWVAGETSISKLSYHEKRRMFGGNVPNLQGFEYYVGGVFVLPGSEDNFKSGDTQSESPESSEPEYVNEFSWRNRHGKDWVTSVKNQKGCGSCSAFGTAAAVELLINQYFNRNLNYDLSEQNLMSCTGLRCSFGGNPCMALNHLRGYGIVMEDCFPYTATDQTCSKICKNPTERIKIDSWQGYYYDSTINSVPCCKKEIMNGATVALVPSWYHTMQLVGYKTLEEGSHIKLAKHKDTVNWITIQPNDPYIGQTALLFKNSWSENWGDNGYAYIIGDMVNYRIYSLYGPVTSRILDSTYVLCTDNDGDGYYYWGIGPKPSHCPDSPEEADGDDSNPCIGPMDEYGNFTYLCLTSEPDNISTEHFQIFPNPTRDHIIIQTKAQERYSIEIVSLNGQIIYRSYYEGPTLKMDLSSLRKGVYFITVGSRDFVRTEKIIKL